MAGKRVDANQPEIVRDIRKAGLHVVYLYTLGQGVPDILVSGYHRTLGVVAALFVEIKTDKGKLTSDELTWHNEYPTDGPLIIARSSEDVFKWFGII